MIPSGCTSKCHPPDVWINKPFKGILHNFWKDYIASIVTDLSQDVQRSENCKLPSPSRQFIINWVVEDLSSWNSHPEVINSFSECGITTHDPQKVRNDQFLRSVMENVDEKLT